MHQKTGEMSYGFASNLRDALPNASSIGFTGTPIEKSDANTRAVFGDLGGVPNTCQFVSLQFDVRWRESQSQARHQSVAPCYDSRYRAPWSFPSTTSSVPSPTRPRCRSIARRPERIALIAADLMAHFEKRVEAMDGKAMIASVELKLTCLSQLGEEKGGTD